MTNTPNQKTQQKRKFLLMLPLLTLPFLTLTFWAMGGGAGTTDTPLQTNQNGINLELPGIAEDSKKALDKLGHYKKSQADSARFLQQVKNDPYYQMTFKPEINSVQEDQNGDSENPDFGNAPLPEYQDHNERLVMERLEVLNQTLSEDPKPQPVKSDEFLSGQAATQPDLSSDLDRLDQMMQQMQAGSGQANPEMQQMGQLLEQILDIQHPERVQARLREGQHQLKSKAFTVSKNSKTQQISNLESVEEHLPTLDSPTIPNGFFGLEHQEVQTSFSNTIKAVIHENQELTSGATVKLRLTEDASIDGLTIPKDQLVYGTAALNGERLTIDINHIRVNDQLLPVALAVHDADGMAGIYIPGSLSREVGTQSGDRAIQGFGISTFDTSLEAQAASAGIETAKSFLGKKIKQVKVTLKAGYQVWLNDENKNQAL